MREDALDASLRLAGASHGYARSRALDTGQFKHQGWWEDVGPMRPQNLHDINRHMRVNWFQGSVLCLAFSQLNQAESRCVV